MSNRRSSRARLDTAFYEATVNTHKFNGERRLNIIDVYRKIYTIGKGSYGTVILVENKVTSQRFACKCIPKSNFRPGQLEKFQIEIELVRRCDHPNIVKIFEYYEDDEDFYLVQEHCVGGELFDYLTAPGFFPAAKNDPSRAAYQIEEKAARIIKQLLNGVAYLHLRGIVHRDIKPENILLMRKGDISTLKIIDFGLSSKMKDDGPLRDQLGTPYYIAPDVLERNYDHKCDIWSLGVILYILICGSAPFNGPNDQAVIRAVKTRQFKMSGKAWHYISSECKDLISHMIIYPPSLRYEATDCLKHPWFARMVKPDDIQSMLNKQVSLYNFGSDELDKNSASLSSLIRKNIRCFFAGSKLRNAIKLCTSYRTVPDRHVQQFVAIFKSMDADDDGMLNEEEFKNAYYKIHDKPAAFKNKTDDAKALALFDKMDLNGDGYIEVSEWLAAVLNENILLSKEKLQDAFNTLDSNGNGKVSYGELNRVLKDHVLLDSLFKSLGKKETDTFTLDEFYQMILEDNNESKFRKQLSMIDGSSVSEGSPQNIKA